MATPYGQTEQGMMDWRDELERRRRAQEAATGGGDAGAIVGQMMGGGGYGGGVDDRSFSEPYIEGMSHGHRGENGTGLAGMQGAPGKQGAGTRGYYRFGAIPTAWNNEVIKPQYYEYSGTPDMAAMIRNPWDPTQWDPNRDFTPGGRTPTEAKQRSMGGRRHRQSRFRR
jgi:hypothetical protein